jgi:HEAT repeat protein
MAALADHDPTTRQEARRGLVSVGEEAVGPLITALHDERTQVRWEAAKALVDIANPRAGPALVATLRDEDSGIRWVAAEALIAMGPESFEPLLEGLIDHSGSSLMLGAAHHVLHELVGGRLNDLVLPVLAALEGPAPEDRAPVVAYAALATLRRDRVLTLLTRSSEKTLMDDDPHRGA